MEKKQTRSTPKTQPTTKAALRKITVRDLGPRKVAEVKGGLPKLKPRPVSTGG